MRKPLALLFATALFVPLAACGGDDGDDEDASSSASASASASGTEEEEEEPSGGAGDGYCDALEEASEAGDELEEAFDEGDPAAFEAGQEILEGLRDEVDNDDVAEDYELLIEAFDVFAEVFAEVGNDPEAQAEAFEDPEVVEQFEEFEAAGERLDEFNLEECGITLDGETAEEAEDDGSFDEVEDDIGSSSDLELGDPSSPPDVSEDDLLSSSGSVDELEDLMDDCEDGDLAACDEVFAMTSVGSPAEDYGSTCGGRLDIEDEVSGSCEAQFG